MKQLLQVVLLAVSTSLTLPALGQADSEEAPVLEVVPDHLAYLYGPQPEAVLGDVQRQLYADKRRSGKR